MEVRKERRTNSLIFLSREIKMLETMNIETIANAFVPLAPYAVGGISGFLVGKMLKLVVKIAAIIAGGIIFLLGALSYTGMISVNFVKVEDVIIEGSKVAANTTYDVLQHINNNFIQNSTESVMIGGSVSFIAGVGLAMKY
ncbi:MAG: FUN14 domain-containing protein [Nitrososphaeraceae archaeon]